MAEMAMAMDTECAKINAECDTKMAELRKQLMIECEQRVAIAKKEASGEYT